MAKSDDSARQRFDKYLDLLSVSVGHADRCGPLREYLTGLYLPGEQKSIEPIAARMDPRHVGLPHQSMQHFVANAHCDDAAVLGWLA